MPVNIAVVQFEIQPFAAEENLKKAERFIRETYLIKQDLRKGI